MNELSCGPRVRDRVAAGDSRRFSGVHTHGRGARSALSGVHAEAGFGAAPSFRRRAGRL